MKTTLVALAALACSTAFLTACDNDDDNTQPASAAEQAFDTKYPDASRVSWEKKAGYYVADFHDTDNHESEAWFDDLGEWWMTETDLPYAQLPEAVKKSFEASDYAKWQQEDIDKLERKNTATIYVIEVEQGENELDLHYTADGILVSNPTTPGGNNNGEHRPSVMPDDLQTQIQQLFPGSTILDIDNETNGKEIDILDGNLHKELYFDTKNTFLFAEWDVRQTDIPATILEALKVSEYGSYYIDDIHVRKTAEGATLYRFELEQNDRDVVVMLDEQGAIVK